MTVYVKRITALLNTALTITFDSALGSAGSCTASVPGRFTIQVTDYPGH